MAINAGHITGFLLGVGTSALGYYVYKKNQKNVDELLKRYGIELPGSKAANYSSMNLEELMQEKEKLEDLIAEKEFAASDKNPETETV